MVKTWLYAGAIGLFLSSPAPPPGASTTSVGVQEPQVSIPTPDQHAFAAAPGPDLSPEPVLEPVPPPTSLPAVQDAVAAEAPPPPSASDGLKIVVSLPLQRAYVFQGGELIDTSPVSTGKRGHETPTGTFPILQKKVHHRSSTHDNAPMPYMQRLTWSGVALHAGRLPGYPASHGCIRLPRSFAKKLYNLTGYGTTVTVTREKPSSAEDALTLA